MMKTIYRSATVFLVMWIAKTLAERWQQRSQMRRVDRRIDEMSLESFPSSDSPSSWAGSEK
jgi:hypothetical protein